MRKREGGGEIDKKAFLAYNVSGRIYYLPCIIKFPEPILSHGKLLIPLHIMNIIDKTSFLVQSVNESQKNEGSVQT